MGLFDNTKKRKKIQQEPLTLSREWEFYPCYSNREPFSIRFDTAIENLTESVKKQYPHIIELAIPFIESNENGFPTRSEIERINKIEDDFPQSAYNVRLIGVINGGNCSRFVFCCGGTGKDVKNIIQTLMGTNKNIEFTKRIFMNNDFQYYNDVIAPSPYERNWIMNRHICDNLRQNGEAFSKPRNIDFCCYFVSLQHLQDVADKLCGQGFVEHNRGKTEYGKYSLEFTLEGIPSFDWVNEITNGILDLLQGTDGYFDGWGCTVVKAEEA